MRDQRCSISNANGAELHASSSFGGDGHVPSTEIVDLVGRIRTLGANKKNCISCRPSSVKFIKLDEFLVDMEVS